MSPEEFIARQPDDRKGLLLALHKLILKNDAAVMPIVEPMMGKEMVIYKEDNTMKYGLSNVMKHISIHSLPIYGHPDLHAKYVALLPAAKFQKGCINLTKPEALPLNIAADFFADCAKISMKSLMAKWKKKTD